MMKRLNLLSALCLALVLLGQVLPAQARSYDDVMASGFIEIAVYKDFAPYSWKDASGKEQGIDVDLAKHIAKKMKLDLKLRWMVPDETLDDDLRNHVWKGHYLGGGIADVMLRVPYDREFAYQTDEFGHVKNDLVHMFGPYQKERWRVGYDPAQMDSLETLAVLRYYPVGVETDSLPDIYLLSAFNGQMRNQVRHFLNLSEAMEAMKRKEIAAMMGMQSQLQWLAEQKKPAMEIPAIALPGLHKLDWDIGMAVHTNYRQFAYALADVVEAAAKDGTLEKISQRYGVSYMLPDLYRSAQ